MSFLYDLLGTIIWMKKGTKKSNWKLLFFQIWKPAGEKAAEGRKGEMTSNHFNPFKV